MDREEVFCKYLQFSSLIEGGAVRPHWMADGNSFWYAEGAPDKIIIYQVDPVAGTREPMFDMERLRKALTPVLGHDPPYRGLPFQTFSFVDDGKTLSFTVEDKTFLLQLDTYTITKAPSKSDTEYERMHPQIIRGRFLPGDPPVMEIPSPDYHWFATLKDYNLWLRSTYDGRSEPVTSDGLEDYAWEVGGAAWSPDSFKLALYKVDTRQVRRIPVVHWLKTTEEVEFFPYTKAGGPMPQTELYVVDILSRRQVRIDTGEQRDQFLFIIGWRRDGSELLFLRADRVLKRLDLMAADPATGRNRIIVAETQESFVEGLRLWEVWGWLCTLLDDGERFVWMSERDGWNHLYLYHLDGTLIQRLTKGAFPVLRVLNVDEKDGWVYFTAHREERLYDMHLYRVTLDGKDVTRLTEGTGQHSIEFAPSKQFFIDTHSSVERPPQVELRTAEGRQLRILSQARINALEEVGWISPEEFVVKADDGTTDLWGVLYKPYDFSPDRKYPIIDYIYNGPFICWVPRCFLSSMAILPQALAQLGFIVLVVDGRGTPERGKAFQDVVYRNFGRHEIPDHMATLRQLAAQRSYIDTKRVGIFGGSWGGYMTVRAMLIAPDVYHVGVATCPVYDLYDHWAFPIEPYMDLPQNNREGYEYASCLQRVDNLKGKLLLMHGTSDVYAPFSATMKMVEALVRAGKRHDLVVLPEQPHWFTGPSRKFWVNAVKDYLIEHLRPYENVSST